MFNNPLIGKTALSALADAEKNGITYAVLAYTYGTNGLPVPEGYEYLVNVWTVYGDDTEKVAACSVNGSEEQTSAVAVMESKGYVTAKQKNGDPYVTHDYNWLELLGHYYSQMFEFDHPGYIQDYKSHTIFH